MKAQTMNVPASLTERAASVATYGGSGTAMYFGYTAGEWQVIGVIGGLVVAVVGLVGNLAITAYYKHRHLMLLQNNLNANLPEE